MNAPVHDAFLLLTTATCMDMNKIKVIFTLTLLHAKCMTIMISFFNFQNCVFHMQKVESISTSPFMLEFALIFNSIIK